VENLREALAEYTAIVEETRAEYSQEELTVEAIRRDHPELDFMDDDEIETIIRQVNEGRKETQIKWYVIIETAPDGKKYVGINDESYWGDGDIVSEYGSQDAAEAASIKYAQEQGLPLFADYKER
jgi:hypothetical protein